MKYGIRDKRRNEYWNGLWKTNTNGVYREPRLTNIAYSNGAKLKNEPKLYSSRKKAEVGLKSMCEKIDELNRMNFDFEVVEVE